MILHQIELQGFLSHRGAPVDGGYGFTTIDFSRSALWLIHGENGTGKSALFDAICFALYKRARGAGAGGHSGQNLGYLVHHQADRAQVRVTVEIGGTVYRVDRAVNHASKSATGGSSQIWESKSDWATLRQLPPAQRELSFKAVVGTNNKAEKWVADQLRMSFETFTYTALLRQGETDAFLVADATDRKKCLLSLLDLSSFEALGVAAARESSDAKKAAGVALDRRNSARAVSAEELANADAALKTADESLKDAQAEQGAAKTALENGEKAENWQREIGNLEAQTAQDAPLLMRKEAIVASANRARELGRVMPQLRAVWSAKTRWNAEEQARLDKQAEEREAQRKVGELQASIAPAQENAATTHKSWRDAQDALESAKNGADVAADEAKELEIIERWEAGIANARRELAPFDTILARETEIESRRKKFAQLNARVPLLANWNEAIEAEARARKSLESAGDERKNADAELESARQNAERCAEVLQAALDAATALDKRIEKSRGQFDNLKARSQERGQVEGEEACHFCGSTLNDEASRARLQQERAKWSERGRELKKQIRELEAELQTANDTIERAEPKNSAAQMALRKAESRLERAKFAVQNAETVGEEKRGFVGKAAAKCAAFAAQLDELESLQNEWDELNRTDVDGDCEKLNRAQRGAIAGQTTIKNAAAELEKLPIWSQIERENVRAAQTKTTENLEAMTQTLAECEKAAGAAQKAFDDLEKQCESRATALDHLGEKLGDLVRRCDAVAQEISGLRGDLPAPWQAHAAVEDAAQFEQLKNEIQRLKGAESEETELRQAQERGQNSIASIRALQQRLAELPAEHRRPVAELQARVAAIAGAIDDAGSALKTVSGVARELEIAASEFARREAELLEAETEAALCKMLAETLGPNGLQRAIQDKAKQKLRAEANKTLLKLSGGEWSISLQEESDDKLEILATDHRSGYDKRFEYLSGGEKFRIAVALAVAIGQSVTGNAPLGTLIIDEGFGALDAANRKRMVAELQRLSEDVFGGGRVIVVSHQDDVCDDFPQRYAIARDANGLVSATRFPIA